MASSATARKRSHATPATQNNIEISGTVTRIKFSNPENDYTILAVNIKNDDEPNESITALGSMSGVRVGDQYKFIGNWTTPNPRFPGRQFKFTLSEIVLPTGVAGVAKYLANIAFGVGQVKAQKIIQMYPDFLSRIKTNPEIIDTLDFLTELQRAEIADHVAKNSVQAELAGLICREGVGQGMVNRIYGKYGAESVKTIKENPYILAEDLWGVGFKTADLIAQSVGIAANNPNRVKAAIDYVLREAGSDGHVYLRPRDIAGKLIGKKGLLECSGVEIGDIAAANGALISESRCIREGDAVYHSGLYAAECSVAQSVVRLLQNSKIILADLDTHIADIESRDGVTYADEQKQAIKSALTSGISVITGGPGTGKTTVINAIVDIYKRLSPAKYIYLAAPTGRAAKRMSEATKMEAKTIHRLLRYNPREGGFEYGSGNPLPGPGMLMVDESSMIDIELMFDLLSAVEDLQVVLVGDIDQLPSVGPGAILRDVIASGEVPTVRLKFNFRQAGGSKIAEYANMICAGETPPLQNMSDFEFVEITEPGQVPDVVLGLVREIVDAGAGPMDFQVLSPMRKNSAGTINLNTVVRELVNPYVPGSPTMGSFRINDKLMVIKNNYKLGVFNGDLGLVVSIERGIISVDFGDGVVEFSNDDLGLLTMAYAGTIHKSQGSEFPIVFMVLTTQHYIMRQRNLLYTGMTRAKKRLVIIADKKSIRESIANCVSDNRMSMLAERIKKGRRNMIETINDAMDLSDDSGDDSEEFPVSD